MNGNGVDDGYLNESQTQSLTQTQFAMLPLNKSLGTAPGSDSKGDGDASDAATGTLGDDDDAAAPTKGDGDGDGDDGVEAKDDGAGQGRVEEEVESQTPYDFSTLPSHACSYCGISLSLYVPSLHREHAWNAGKCNPFLTPPFTL